MAKRSIKDTLRGLMNEHGISENELARRTSVKQPTIHRILSGTTEDPRASSLVSISRYFDVSIEYLLGIEDKREGYTASVPAEGKPVKPIRYAPVLEWDEAKEICTNSENPPDKENRKAVFSDAGYRSFWLQMRGNAMYPFLRDKESYLCVDPEKEAKHGALCLVREKATDELMVRMVMIDGSLKIIKTIHPDFPFNERMDDRFQYCGLVTEDHHSYAS